MAEAGSAMVIQPFSRRIRVFACGAQIADTRSALELIEEGYRPVYYLPRADIQMKFLQKTSTRTHCPRKGDASYFTINVLKRRAGDAAWSYEKPIAAAADIAGFIAFDPLKVDRIEIS